MASDEIRWRLVADARDERREFILKRARMATDFTWAYMNGAESEFGELADTTRPKIITRDEAGFIVVFLDDRFPGGYVAEIHLDPDGRLQHVICWSDRQEAHQNLDPSEMWMIDGREGGVETRH